MVQPPGDRASSPRRPIPRVPGADDGLRRSSARANPGGTGAQRRPPPPNVPLAERGLDRTSGPRGATAQRLRAPNAPVRDRGIMRTEHIARRGEVLPAGPTAARAPLAPVRELGIRRTEHIERRGPAGPAAARAPLAPVREHGIIRTHRPIHRPSSSAAPQRPGAPGVSVSERGIKRTQTRPRDSHSPGGVAVGDPKVPSPPVSEGSPRQPKISSHHGPTDQRLPAPNARLSQPGFHRTAKGHEPPPSFSGRSSPAFKPDDCSILLCVFRKRHHSWQSHRVDIHPSDIKNDKELFLEFRTVYRNELQGAWRRYTSLKALKYIGLLHYQDHESIIREEFPSPFIQEDIMGQYDNPDEINDGEVWIRWVEDLKSDPVHRYALEFVESWDGQRIILLGAISILAIVGFSGIWIAKGGDLGTVFTVMGFVLTITATTMALLGIYDQIDR